MINIKPADHAAVLREMRSLFGVGPQLRAIDAALSAMDDARWRPIETAPRDGNAFLAYGRHDTDNKNHWRKGYHWWAIVLYDVWREVGMGGSEFVFAKDGARTWSTPTHWRPLPAPPQAAMAQDGGDEHGD